MDLSLPMITPEFWQDCGAQAFDDGLPVTAHNMNPGAPAIRDFEDGWHRQRVLRARQAVSFGSGAGHALPHGDSAPVGSVEIAHAQRQGLSGIEAGQQLAECPP